MELGVGVSVGRPGGAIGTRPTTVMDPAPRQEEAVTLKVSAVVVTGTAKTRTTRTARHLEGSICPNIDYGLSHDFENGYQANKVRVLAKSGFRVHLYH